jgi:hypothetical protein
MRAQRASGDGQAFAIGGAAPEVLQLPLQAHTWARSSVMARLANKPFMPPTGQR